MQQNTFYIDCLGIIEWVGHQEFGTFLQPCVYPDLKQASFTDLDVPIPAPQCLPCIQGSMTWVAPIAMHQTPGEYRLGS